MAPINLPDGSQVSEIVLPDGSTASEVLAPDGSTVFGNAIPDSEDLHAHYDATTLGLSDGDSVTTWADETSNDHDLTAGDAPTFRTDVLSSNPVVRFDGDYLDVAFSSQAQPNHVFVVVATHVTDEFGYVMDAESGSRQAIRYDDDGDMTLFAGSNGDVSYSPGTSFHVFSVLFDGSDSQLRADGSDKTTGDPGDGELDGITLGDKEDEGTPLDGDVAELLIYPMDKSDVAADVESYLNDKWGVF